MDRKIRIYPLKVALIKKMEFIKKVASNIIITSEGSANCELDNVVKIHEVYD